MKTALWIPFIIIPLLFACAPKRPEIPMVEVPAEPLVQALVQHARAFSNLKALASVQVARKDRRRSFESAAILVKGQEQFRIEAYGPLGDTLVTLVWSGKELLLDLGGQRRLLQPKNAGLERILGADIDPAELCAVLSGNIPGILTSPRSRLLCAENGACILELQLEKTLVRVQTGPGREAPDVVSSYQVYREGRLVYKVIFQLFEQVSGYDLPKRIRVENPEKHLSLNVEYADTDVNTALDSSMFIIPALDGTDR